MKDWQEKLAIDFDKKITYLDQIRQEDQADAIYLHRNDVITILEGVKLLKEFLDVDYYSEH